MILRNLSKSGSKSLTLDIHEEEREEGEIKMDTYLLVIKAMGLIIVLAFILMNSGV